MVKALRKDRIQQEASCPSSPPGPPTKQCHVLVAQPYILILFSLFRQSIQFFSTNRCLFYIMDPLRTELKQCSKKSCKNSIPPPSNPGTKDYLQHLHFLSLAQAFRLATSLQPTFGPQTLDLQPHPYLWTHCYHRSTRRVLIIHLLYIY
jgi:hypothetical protein